MSTSQRYLEANQAGQAATIATVEAVTGQKIDHFAEVNLAGFYYLAGAFGGIEVCLKPSSGDANLNDTNSGFNAVLDGYNVKKGGSQYLHLSAPQALAFVRERDNLPNGDLDRTHRQQAVLDYVIWKLEHNGDPVRPRPAHLAAQYRQAVPHHRLDLEPARLRHPDARADREEPAVLHGADRGLRDHRRPGRQPGRHPDDPGRHQEKFTAPVPAAKSTSTAKSGREGRARPGRVDRHRGRLQRRHHPGLATGISQALVAKGYKAGAVTNASAQSQAVTSGTQVFYGAGASANAAKIADYFGATAVVAHVAARRARRGAARHRRHRGAGHPGPGVVSRASSPPRPRRRPSTSAGNNGAAGGALTVTRRPSTASPACTNLRQGRRQRWASDRGQGPLRGGMPGRGRADGGVRVRPQGGRADDRPRQRASRSATAPPSAR